jgi:hypothetical protein
MPVSSRRYNQTSVSLTVHTPPRATIDHAQKAVEAVKTLAGLLSTEERHQIKKHQLFREFTRQNGIFEVT